MLKIWLKSLLLVGLWIIGFGVEKSQIFANINNAHTSVEADTITYDHANNAILAQGNVIAENQEYQVKTEKMRIDHDQKTIALPTKSVINQHNKKDRYEVATLSFDYEKKIGKLYDVNAKLKSNQITLKAKEIEINERQHTIIDAIGTPCKICDTCEIRQALWQLRAKQIKADDDDIFYRNVHFDLLGKTVLYLPYFKTPGLKCSRRSGFLMPKLYYNNKWGAGLRMPYYWNIMPNMDFTISPSFYTKQSPVYDWELRHLLSNRSGYRARIGAMYGASEDTAIYTANSSDLNSYVNLDANFQLNDKSDVGLNFEHIFSPKNAMLKGYQISTNDILVSNTYWRKYLGPSNNGYASAELTALQDLRHKEKYTHILPRVQLYYSHPVSLQLPTNKIKTFVEIDGELLSIHGEDSDGKKIVADRIKVGARMLFKYYDSTIGEIGLNPGFTLNALSQNRYNNVSNHHLKEYSMLSPDLELMLKRPFFHLHNGGIWTIEPVAKLILMPSKKRPIPYIEQSFLEHNNSGLFDSGLRHMVDQIMQGSRVEYGIGGHYSGQYDLSIILGHSYRFYKYMDGNAKYNGTSIFPNNKRSGNYTINTQFNWRDFNIAARTWLRTSNIKPVHSEIDASLKFGKIKFEMDYTFLDNNYYSTSITNGNQELGANLWYKIHSSWSVNINTRAKIGKNNQTRSSGRFISKGFGLQYEMDCLKVNFSVSRNYLRMQNSKPTTTYAISLGIPSLGM